MQGAIEVRAEGDAVVVDGSMLGQRKNLIATAVGEQRVRPFHEPDDSPVGGHRLGAWAKPKVIAVGQNDARAGRRNLVRRERFDRRLSSDGHEGGSFDGGTRSCELSAPCISVDRVNSK